jgi:hypothetical protein
MWVCLGVACVSLETRQTICACIKYQIKKPRKSKRYIYVCMSLCVCICPSISGPDSKIRDHTTELCVERWKNNVTKCSYQIRSVVVVLNNEQAIRVSGRSIHRSERNDFSPIHVNTAR